MKDELEITALKGNVHMKCWFFCLVGVRLDRVRGGRQKYKRTVDSGPIVQQIFPMIKKACVESTKSGNQSHQAYTTISKKTSPCTPVLKF